MLRSFISAVALAGVLMAVQPAFADALPAVRSDPPGAPVSEPSAPLAPAAVRSPASEAPPNSVSDKGFIPVGFGWG